MMYLSHVYNILFNKNIDPNNNFKIDSNEEIDDKQLKSFDTTDFLNYINNMLENINNYNDDTKLKIYETYQDLIIDSNIKKTHKTLIDTINNTNNLDEKIIESIINDLHIKIMINRLDFNNLNNSLKSANILIDDLRVHPKRYVQFSVFGKKEKSGPLLAPIIDTASSNKQ